MDVKLLKPLLLACTSVSLIACQQQVVADPNEPAQTGDQQPNTSTVSLPLTTIEQDTSLTLNASDVLYRYQFYGEQPFLSNQDSLIEPIADSASNEFGVNLGELFPAQMVDSQYYNLAAPISSSANSVEYSLDTSLYCASFNYESNQEVLDCAADATGFSLHIAAHSFESGIANIKFEGNTVLQLGYQPERLVLVMDLDNQSDIQPSDVSMSGKLAWLYNLSAQTTGSIYALEPIQVQEMGSTLSIGSGEWLSFTVSSDQINLALSLPAASGEYYVDQDLFEINFSGLSGNIDIDLANETIALGNLNTHGSGLNMTEVFGYGEGHFSLKSFSGLLDANSNLMTFSDNAELHFAETGEHVEIDSLDISVSHIKKLVSFAFTSGTELEPRSNGSFKVVNGMVDFTATETLLNHCETIDDVMQCSQPNEVSVSSEVFTTGDRFDSEGKVTTIAVTGP